MLTQQALEGMSVLQVAEVTTGVILPSEGPSLISAEHLTSVAFSCC